MAIELGKLYQYKIESIGLAYKECPKRLFVEPDHKITARTEFVGPTQYDPKQVKAFPWETGFFPWNIEKMLVLPCKLHVVSHPWIKSIQTTYVYALVSVDRNDDWKPYWIREEWIEPLDGDVTESYQKTMGKKCLSVAREFLRKNEEKRAQQQERSPKDIFLEIMRTREESPKK